MCNLNVSVVHFADHDGDVLFSTQQQILRELSEGRDVVLVCEADVVRRAERMTFACLALRSEHGRFAIVARNADRFSERLPTAMVECLHVFSNQDEALRWLRPGVESMKETQLYFTLN
jgi:hypothetical protein